MKKIVVGYQEGSATKRSTCDFYLKKAEASVAPALFR